MGFSFKHSFNIVKKELDKIFRNPRLIFSTFILPGLMIFVIYSTMGNFANTESNKAVEETSIIYVVNSPKSFEEIIDDYNMNYPVGNVAYLNANFVKYTSSGDLSEDQTVLEEKIKEGLCHAFIIFQDNFETILNEHLDDSSIPLPVVSYYSDSTSSTSSVASQKISTLLSLYKEEKIFDKYGDITIFQTNGQDISSSDDQAGMILGMILPMLLMIFVFAGGLSIGADSIAGEKERGTIATLLMAPITKNEIVVGKVISTIIITILSSVGSFLGVALSLPNASSVFGGASLSVFTVPKLAALLILILSTALIAVTLFMIASTLAKSVKEATTYSMPFYILGMVISVSTMFVETSPTEIWRYLIPIYNLSVGMKGILLGDLNVINLLIIVASNFIYFIMGLILMSKLFKNEKIMFAK